MRCGGTGPLDGGAGGHRRKRREHVTETIRTRLDPEPTLGLSAAGDAVFQPLDASIRRRRFQPPAAPQWRLVPLQLSALKSPGILSFTTKFNIRMHSLGQPRAALMSGRRRSCQPICIACRPPLTALAANTIIT